MRRTSEGASHLAQLAAFEAAVEFHLLTFGGCARLDPATFDPARGLDPSVFLSFVQQTQHASWQALVENERLGTDFKPADQLFFDAVRQDAVADSALRQVALANSLENFGYVFLRELEN